MGSKENLYNLGKNVGKLVLAGSALYGAASHVDQTNHNPETNHNAVVQGQVLTAEEIAQLRNYENIMAANAVVKQAADFKALMVKNSDHGSQIKPELTSDQAKQIEKYKQELPDVLKKINADSQQTEDLEIYYPIYRAAGDKFGVPWDLLWIVHEQESTVSRNAAAFESNIHYGAMQRAVEFHPQEDVDRANVGLEYLQALPARHFDDAVEIVWAAAAVGEWSGEQNDFHRALLRYSARGPAEERFQKFLELESFLKP